MRNCEYYEELISRSLDDALSVEERRELAVHLASCPSCNQMRQLMADISGMMEEDMEELPAGLHENIMADIRRSEMIKANKPAGSPGKHFVPRKFSITRPVRNILATAACMALVIAAAVSVNPASRAEDVIAARSMPEVAETQAPQTAAAAPATVEPAEPAAAPTPSPVPTREPVNKGTGTDTIVTTPAPTQNIYLSTPTPAPTQAPAQTITGTPIGKATPAPASTPMPMSEPVVTEAPVPMELPQPTEAPAMKAEEKVEQIEAATQAADAAVADQNGQPVEIQKAPPVRVFSLIPSLAELLPEQSPAEDGGGTGTELLAAPPAATTAPTPVPTDAPQPLELNLIESEKAGDLVLLLAGTLDENGQPPEAAELPEGSWDESFVVEMAFDDIPCELTVRIYGEEVYFCLAEILIDPAAVDSAVQAPASTPAVIPEPVEGMAPVTGSGDCGEVQAGDFEPQWLLAKCGSVDFKALLEEAMK